jgi:beta-glucosidase
VLCTIKTYLAIEKAMARSILFTTVLCATSLANVALGNQQPWLDQSLSSEERLQSFIAQLNTTQKLAMTQGDTEVMIPLFPHVVSTPC